MTTYTFTHDGETKTMTVAEIKKWTGMPMVQETLRNNLDWLTENIGNPKFKMLAFTTHGVMMASHYREVAGRVTSIAAARRSEFTKNAVRGRRG
jgi:hypothetical protein